MTTFRLRGEGVAWTDVDGEIVALDESAAVYLAANETGGLLWRTLVGGATHGELVSALVATYDVEPERAAGDIDAFLAALRERHLLEAG
jgi:hypothetical protein